MINKYKSQSGSAMALVLVFTTMLGGWLGVTMLLNQVSASGGQRLLLQTANSSQSAIATATVLEQLIVNPAFGSAAYTSVSQPNCGLALSVGSVSVSCTPVSSSSQALTSTTVTTTQSSGSTVGVDNGISVTGSHIFNSVIQSFSNNITVTGGSVSATQILTPAGIGIAGIKANIGSTPGSVANLATTSIVPVLPVADPGTGIGGSLNLVLPNNCPALNSTITIAGGNYNDEAIDQLNMLFVSEIIRTYKANGTYTDKDCSANFGWGHKIDISFGQGLIYFKGIKLLDIKKNINDLTESIALHNDANDAVVSIDASGNPTGCTYKHGFTASNPITNSDISGTQILFGGAAGLANEDGDFKLCGPHQVIGQSIAILTSDSAHASVCAAKKSSAANCPAIHTGLTPLLRAYGNGSTKTYIYGTVLASGTSVRIDESAANQHQIDGGIVADGASFNCSLASGTCPFPVQAGPSVSGRHLKITLRNANGSVVEREIIIDDNSGLNPANHISITSSGS
jgi:hypothetical protein